jgi:iron-sulfur cluster repair protein YtfE (RIC family)
MSAKTDDTLADSLIPHMRKEEAVLFPCIQMLESSFTGNSPATLPHFGTVANPIRMMMADHEEDGGRLRIMREITSDYTLLTAPAQASPHCTRVCKISKEICTAISILKITYFFHPRLN